jgi:D-alanyl-D-alanine carboxypeptidase
MRTATRLAGSLIVAAALVAAALVAATSGTARADRRAGPSGRVLARVAAEVRRATNAPGAIVALQRGRHRPVIVAAGTRDRRGGGRIRPDDPFVTASVSKAFTGALVLALVEAGRLSLDDPVVGYVPGWDRRITVRHLLDHSSGLPSWGNKDDPPESTHAALVEDLSRSFTMAESLEPVRAMPLLARPGSATHYSNANTLLAGMVVEQVTGTTLAAAYRRHVLGPLRLRATGYAAQEAPPGPPIPGVLFVGEGDDRVELDTAQFPQTSSLTLGGPSLAMVSNAPDLLRFAQAFLRGSFPSRRLADRARRIGRGGAGLGVIGFGPDGYCIFDGCPRRVVFRRIGFAGNTSGVAVRVVHDPGTDVTALVFANSSERGKLDPFVDRLLDRHG